MPVKMPDLRRYKQCECERERVREKDRRRRGERQIKSETRGGGMGGGGWVVAQVGEQTMAPLIYQVETIEDFFLS